MWDWWKSGVKRVTDDLGAEITRPRSSAHSATRVAWAARALDAVGMWELENESVKSSAYDVVSCGERG